MEDWENNSHVENVQETVASKIDTPDIKLFGKWSLNDIEISDISLVVCFFF